MTDDPNPWLTFRLYDSPKARRFAELGIVQTDVERAYHAFRIWADRYIGPDLKGDDSWIGPSLFRDAVVQLVGAFADKKRHGLDISAILSPANGTTEFYQWLRDLRDSYAAHNFGPLRQASVGIMPIIPGVTSEVGLSLMTSCYSGPSEAGDILRFVEGVRRYVEAQVEIARQEVQAEIAGLDDAQIEALPQQAMGQPEPEGIRMSRERFTKESRQPEG